MGIFDMELPSFVAPNYVFKPYCVHVETEICYRTNDLILTRLVEFRDVKDCTFLVIIVLFHFNNVNDD